MLTSNLRTLHQVGGDTNDADASADAAGASAKAPLSLDDLAQQSDDGWDESQYASAFSIDSFREGFAGAAAGGST